MTLCEFLARILLTASALNAVQVVLRQDPSIELERGLLTLGLLALAAFCLWQDWKGSAKTASGPGARAEAGARREGMVAVAVASVAIASFVLVAIVTDLV